MCHTKLYYVTLYEDPTVSFPAINFTASTAINTLLLIDFTVIIGYD